MAKHKIFKVDAFADNLFEGNPAAVVPINTWSDDTILQKIAMENNLSETSFFVHLSKNEYELRWFTPTVEVDLCGHATLASAWVIWNRLGSKADTIHFHTKSGILKITKNNEMIEMDFPIFKSEKLLDWDHDRIKSIFGIDAQEYYTGEDQVLIFRTETELRKLKPNFHLLKEWVVPRGWIATVSYPEERKSSNQSNVDYKFRFFAPNIGIDEDPATGSAQCILAPIWAEKLNITELKSKQLSSRIGSFQCVVAGERIKIKGQVVFFLEGEIEIP